MSPPAVDESNPWAVLRTDVRFDCSYYVARQDLVSFSGAAPRPYNTVRFKNNGVAVAPVDEDGRVTLVGQYRYPLDRYTWEMPAGGVKSGANVVEVAKAELSEETGLRARHWLKIIDGSASPSTTDEFAWGYVAWGLEKGEAHPDPEEKLTLRTLPFAEAVDMVLRHEISHLASAALLLGIQVRLTRGDLPEELSQALLRR